MSRKHLVISIMIFILPCSYGFCQEQIRYKQVDTTKLYMEVYYPETLDRAKEYPAIVFFFWGGWSGGSVEQFEPHANYFSKRGMICFLADYRVKTRQQTTPFESLKVAKSAVRFIRENAGWGTLCGSIVTRNG